MIRRSLVSVVFMGMLCALVGLMPRAWAVNCQVVHHGPPSDADKALLSGDYQKAADFFRADLASHPNDVELTAGLVHALLRQQKLKEAADVAKAALATAPNSPALMTLNGEVQYRQGFPWDAAKTVEAALKLDPCNPRTRLLTAELSNLSSLYAQGRAQILAAHTIDPEDPDIREEWIDTLPRKQRIVELEKFLAGPTGDDPEDRKSTQEYLEHLKKEADGPRRACHLASETQSTEIPFAPIMEDAYNILAYGLDVKLNGKKARLQIDTGAGGLLVSRSIADHAGLKALTKEMIGGIGDEGDKKGYSAYVDSIQIGNLVFKDCQVGFMEERHSLEDVDGLIGMDVFSRFLVTLDYPMRKLLLGPLPPRPGQASEESPTLETDTDDKPDAENSSSAASGAQGTGTSTTQGQPAVAKPAAHGPYDRYIAPEMKSYTPVYRVGHDLILPTALNGHIMRLFIMDTGAFATSVSPDAVKEVTKVHRDHSAEVSGISGKVNKVYTTGDITFAFAHTSQKMEGVYAFDTSGISKNAGLEISGFIGADTLGQLTIHIDYRDGLVKFDYDPNRGYKF